MRDRIHIRFLSKVSDTRVSLRENCMGPEVPEVAMTSVPLSQGTLPCPLRVAVEILTCPALRSCEMAGRTDRVTIELGVQAQSR